MLKTRVLTALVLLAILLPTLYFDSFPAVLAIATLFIAAAAWESARLFGFARPRLAAVLWSAVFLALAWQGAAADTTLLFSLCVAIWAVRLAPALKIGLPPAGGVGNRLLGGIYGIAILGCFAAIVALFLQSPLYLLSAMAIVWIADIGAYFAGKAFGRRKLAPSISPGKSWEGALGGWLAVLLVAALAIVAWPAADLFPARLQRAWGWGGLAVALTVIVAASIIGDLFESQLKRRAGMKDSSALLPGHGGVLDRIDSLIPVLPLAVLCGSWA
ncbi:MAG: phosphatidate cytidylyltransferase [Burkholderiaceae bacterium]